MARITVEDCLKKVNNRFALIHMVSKRVRQLRKGAEPTITSKNRDIVISLREIAAGNVEGVGGGDHDKLLEDQTSSIPEGTENGDNEEKTKVGEAQG
jgi:DNA-directed RNA polymerase subunit omega